MARGEGIRKKAMSSSQKAGVVFPVSRFRRFFKRSMPNYRISPGAAVYSAAALEYLCAEILELAGNAARDNNKKRITPRHVMLAVGNDHELNQLCQGVIFASGGVMPNILPHLLQRKADSAHFFSKAGATGAVMPRIKQGSPKVSKKAAAQPATEAATEPPIPATAPTEAAEPRGHYAMSTGGKAPRKPLPTKAARKTGINPGGIKKPPRK